MKTELLKQAQYEPISVAMQIVAIYALNNGLLNDIVTSEVLEWEQSLYKFLQSSKLELLKKLDAQWSDDIAGEVISAIEEHLAVWKS